MDEINMENSTIYLFNKDIVETIYVDRIINNEDNRAGNKENLSTLPSIFDEFFNKSIFKSAKDESNLIRKNSNNILNIENQENESKNDKNPNLQIEEKVLLNFIKRFINSLNTTDEIIKKEKICIENNEENMNNIIKYINDLITEIKNLKENKVKKENEIFKKNIENFQIVKNEDIFTQQNYKSIKKSGDKVEINNFDEKIKKGFKINQKNDNNLVDNKTFNLIIEGRNQEKKNYVNEIEELEENLSIFNINNIAIKNKNEKKSDKKIIKKNSEKKNEFCLNFNMNQILFENVEESTFSLFDNFIQKRTYLYLEQENRIKLRIYNNSKEDFIGKVEISIDNILEIQEKVKHILKLQPEKKIHKIPKKNFYEFELLITTYSELINFKIKFNCKFIQEDNFFFEKKLIYEIFTSDHSDELNSILFFGEDCSEIDPVDKVFLYSLLKNGKIFMERNEFLLFLSSFDYDIRKIVDILL